MRRARLIAAAAGALALVGLSYFALPAFPSSSGGLACYKVYPRPALKHVGDSAPAWSPDGKKIAFSRSGTINVWDLRNRTLRTIDDGADPNWSPNGKSVVFSREVVIELTYPPPPPPPPSPPPPPQSRRGIPPPECLVEEELFEAPASGREDAVQITYTLYVSEAAPTWSARSGLAYRFKGNGTGGIAVLDPSGRSYRVLVSALGAESPSWSRDGRRLAFAIDNVGSDIVAPSFFGDIITANADGSGAKSVAYGPAFTPTWAPNGRRLAFARDYGLADPNSRVDLNRGRTRSEIFVIAPNPGSGERFLAKGFDPAWSPDGRGIVLARERAYPRLGKCFVSNLFVASTKGKRKRAEPLLPRELRATPAFCGLKVK